jgi:hypothetical protein
MLKVVPKETLKTWDDSDLAFQLKQAGHPGEPTPRTILDLRKALDILPETKAPEQPAAPASVTKGSEHDESIQLRKALTGEEIRASHRRNIVAATKEMLKVVPREELLKWTDEDLDRQLKQAGHTGKNSSPDTILALREALDILPRQRPPLSTFNQ